jgi:catechol 1,2-dioxygenase
MSDRCEEVVGELIRRIHALVTEYDVSYGEYQQAKQWLIDVGEAGEWPLLLDVFVEHVVETQAHKDRPGSEGTILGPYHLPGSPVLDPPYELPQRPDEKGEKLVFSGRVLTSEGTPLAGAVLDVWHADAEGCYSGFSDIPDRLLRGKVLTGEDGRFIVRTIMPAPYTIPHDGPTGRLIVGLGQHPWRPAHIHVLVSADGYEELITQLYLDSSDYLGEDVASAVKDSLVVHPERRGEQLAFDYEFRLARVRAPAGVA